MNLNKPVTNDKKCDLFRWIDKLNEREKDQFEKESIPLVVPDKKIFIKIERNTGI